MNVGIDFGTCYSAYAVMKGSLPVTYMNSKVGSPTEMAYSKRYNREVYGDDCKSQDIVGSFDQVIRYFKRTIRENPSKLYEQVNSNGKNYSYEQVFIKFLSDFIAEIKKSVVESHEFENTDIESITVTAPVGVEKDNMTSSDYSRLLAKVIKDITNLPESKINILQEPVAAAMSYINSENLVNLKGTQRIMVFDLGGGTLDVTIVEYDVATLDYRVAQKDGDLYLGGLEWDKALLGLFLSETDLTEEDLKKLPSQEISDLNQAITNCKIDLSTKPKSSITFDSETLDDMKVARITREAFENATLDLLNRAMKVVNDSIQHYNNGNMKAINKVVLVGGSSNMPQIRQGLLTFFPDLTEDKLCLHDPSLAICKGAAVYSMNMNQDSGIRSIGVVHDTTSASYGFAAVNADFGKPMIYNVIYKGTEFGSGGVITVAGTEWFTPKDDKQTFLSVTVYESIAEKKKDNSQWADMNDGKPNGLTVRCNIPAAYRGCATQFKIKVTLELNHNQILTIKLTDGDGKVVATASR